MYRDLSNDVTEFGNACYGFGINEIQLHLPQVELKEQLTHIRDL
jgi:hypothetical protein